MHKWVTMYRKTEGEEGEGSLETAETGLKPPVKSSDIHINAISALYVSDSVMVAYMSMAKEIVQACQRVLMVTVGRVSAPEFPHIGEIIDRSGGIGAYHAFKSQFVPNQSSPVFYGIGAETETEETEGSRASAMNLHPPKVKAAFQKAKDLSIGHSKVGEKLLGSYMLYASPWKRFLAHEELEPVDIEKQMRR
ncbi:hypothetical protein QKD39_gp14 [Psittacine adenovirus 1]|uniref:Uncharacterized protein n=1 Tax=Psittacine adenovirus 1 TaxID=318592 RepID=A0A2Z5E0H0_9ADEN|nr:hypothetical protein QKD39_gp14 [Psittacine adenovirus 1]AXB73004.1 hypothetical protein [Psittacine adenovirus 1]